MFVKRVNYHYNIIFAIAGLILLSAGVSSAQEKAGESIFKYKKELSITDTQEKNLRGILSKLNTYLAEKTRELDILRAQLNKMIADRANLNAIKVKLRNIAKIQADASYEDIASVRAIEEELTATQMSRWRAIQEDFRKNRQDAQAATSKAKEVAEQPKVEAKAAVTAPVVVE